MFSVTVTVASVGFRSIKRSKRIVTAASVFRFGLAAAAEGPGCGTVSGESPCGRRGADPGEGASGPFTGDSAAGHFRPPPRSPQLHGTSPLLQPGNRRSSRAPSAPGWTDSVIRLRRGFQAPQRRALGLGVAPWLLLLGETRDRKTRCSAAPATTRDVRRTTQPPAPSRTCTHPDHAWCADTRGRHL